MTWIDTGQQTRTMFIPAFQAFGELEITIVAPAQETREDAENLKLDYIRLEIEKKSARDLEEWEVNFLRHLKASDDDLAWKAANDQGPADEWCAFEGLIGGNLHTIEIEVPL